MFTRRVALAGLATFSVQRRAVDFPKRTITIVVPYPPGGPLDLLARLVAQEARTDLGQAIVVDNRAGGSGVIGSNAVAHAAPDGHTLVLGTNQTHATNQNLIKNCPYDAVHDFAAVAGIARMPHVLVVHKDSTLSSVHELIASAKANPGGLTFGSTGNGSGSHLAGELFKIKAGIALLHVPFKGVAPMTSELVAGRIDLSIAPLPGLIAKLIEAGTVRALGVASAQRTPQLASLPTLAEGGIAGVEADAWSALFAPADTPAPVVERLYGAVEAVFSQDQVRALVARQGIPIALQTPAQLAGSLPGEIAKWAVVIKAANVTVD
jgi:tripartite-type tricarboxylate transporter receptor subunit TctC